MAPQFPLVGRATEQATITQLLDQVAGQGSALVIAGSPGVGKSALVEWAGASAESFRILRGTGTAAEFDLPYAGLHQLLRPIIDRTTALPQHRAATLGAAFGRVSESQPDLYAVAMSALDLLAEAAAERPLLLLVDDAQWMDPASQQALAFIARRLASDRIVMLATHRHSDQPAPLLDPSLPSIELAPLGEQAAAELLDRSARRLEPRVRSAVLDLADGDPLALLELPRTIGPAASADAEWLPLTKRLENSFVARVEDLDTTTRAALTVAALSDSDDLSEILGATGLLLGTAATSAVFGPAVHAELVILSDRTVSFRHPLVRSALYQRLDPATRQAGHAALAQVIASHPERSIWHQAAATLHPDAALAAAPEEAADRYLRRGATLNAVHALERAAQLSSAVPLWPPAENGTTWPSPTSPGCTIPRTWLTTRYTDCGRSPASQTPQ